jgi:prevent-host-death family protein
MTKKPTGSRTSRQRRPGGWIAAADFKATCLELMDRVRETRAEYVVTKHGRPVAKLVPYTDPERKPFLGSMKGTVLHYERPLDPLDDEWDVNRE